ncbi:putative phosphatidylinositol 4-phosphate 5-kinase MSS4 [Diplonema papillatum]|nr:putative phosphatidylinositol 4-phosphate 5-kinase MSS4 [Diplonema papillatum]
MQDLGRVRAMFGVAADEPYLGTLWDEGYVACECARRGAARVWLFQSCIGLEFELEQAPEAFDFRAIHLEPSWKAFIQRNSFSVPPVCYAELAIVSVDKSRATASLVFTDANGWEASRAIQFVWQHANNELSERNHFHLSCNRFIDVVAVSCKYPVEDYCTINGVAKGAGRLKLQADGVLHFLPSQKEGAPRDWLLDDIIMIRKGKGLALAVSLEIIVLSSEEGDTETFVFTNFTDINKFETALTKSWCLNCNSVVNFRLNHNGVNEKHGDALFCPSPHRKKRASPFSFREIPDKVCFSVNEVVTLLKTFQTMDEDRSGMLSKPEWIVSLGPVFRHTQVPHAVFSVFDQDNDNWISFPEFLFGCRVLQLGSEQDRMQYQYRIFDSAGTGYMTRDQFYQVSLVIQEVVGLRIPTNMTLEDYCRRLFAKMDHHRTGRADIVTFKESLQNDAAFAEALEAMTNARRKVEDAKGSKRAGKPVWFGDPQWLQCTAILLGLKLSEDHRVKAKMMRPDQGMLPEHYTEKAIWELGSRQLLADAKAVSKRKPAPGVESKGSRVHPLIAYESYFIDYSPQVFLAVQARFGVSPDAYKESLGIDQLHLSLLVGSLSNLNSVASSGRSGAFFFASHDGKFILKTIDKEEGKILRRFLPAYYEHVMRYPTTLLTRYFGLHALCYGGEKMYFLVMNNVLTPPEPFRLTISYDLKGSTVNRTTPLNRRKHDVALKDLDFKRKLDVEPETRRALMAQIRADSELLQRCRLNDYSLLLGIHTATDTIPSPPVGFAGRNEPFFMRFHGGIASRDRREIYYVGIIDLLTEFGIKKKGEYTVKTVWYSTRGGKVSCVPPEEYRERFVQFIESIFPPPINSWGEAPKRGSSVPSEAPYMSIRGRTPSSFTPLAASVDMLSPPSSPR